MKCIAMFSCSTLTRQSPDLRVNNIFLAIGVEGTVAPKICFIKQGICQLKKILSVASLNQDGKKVNNLAREASIPIISVFNYCSLLII